MLYGWMKRFNSRWPGTDINGLMKRVRRPDPDTPRTRRVRAFLMGQLGRRCVVRSLLCQALQQSVSRERWLLTLLVHKKQELCRLLAGNIKGLRGSGHRNPFPRYSLCWWVSCFAVPHIWVKKKYLIFSCSHAYWMATHATVCCWLVALTKQLFSIVRSEPQLHASHPGYTRVSSEGDVKQRHSALEASVTAFVVL